MKGRWQREVPTKSGLYWRATRCGRLTGIVNKDEVFDVVGWAGWWWSEPVEEPPKPPAWGAPDSMEVLRRIEASMPKKKRRKSGPAKAKRGSRGDDWLGALENVVEDLEAEGGDDARQ